MEEFYSLLIKPYNEFLSTFYEYKEGRISTYKDVEVPAYWEVLYKELNKLDKHLTVFEIGSGIGDVLALIHFSGFHKIRGIEMDEYLVSVANDKLNKLFGLESIIMNGKYPTNIGQPDILVQINCVYFEGMCRKEEFINQLINFYENANPKHYFVEVIDSSYTAKSKIFPDFVRISEEDIYRAFSGLKISSFLTYQFPKNSSTKRLYIISK